MTLTDRLKTFLKQWLFFEDVKKLEEIVSKSGKLSEANEYFIEKGKRLTQHQLNNPGIPYRRVLMGHGVQLAVKHLGIKSLSWERSFRAEARKAASKCCKEGGWQILVRKVFWNPKKVIK